MATILNSAILDSDTCCTKLWLKLHFNLTQTHSFWLNFDDGSHLEFCHLGFSHFAQNSDSTPNSIWLKLIHSDSWMAAILNSAILDSAITKKNITHAFSLWIMAISAMDSAIVHKKDLHSFILTQLDDGSHIEFCHLQFSHFGQKNFT